MKQPDKEDGEDAEDEGEDGGQEEAPPLPLLQALLLTVDGQARGAGSLHDPLTHSLTHSLIHSLTARGA